MSERWIPICRLCATFVAIVTAYSAQAQDPTTSDIAIVYFETVSRAAIASHGAALKSATESLSFDAYGRHFDFALEANDRIAPSGKTQSLRLSRGTLRSAPASWVRLASTADGGLRGMIWDGSQLYLIEPAAAVRGSLLPPLQAADGETLIFRLADTLISPGAMTCDTSAATDTSKPASPRTGQDVYDSQVRELRAAMMKGGTVGLQGIGASLRLEMSIVGDAAFRARYASDEEASNEILIRMNSVDGIYSQELGVAIQAPLIKVTTDATQALSATTVPLDLLNSLANLRKNSADLRSKGLTHLFTGRDLDTTTVGIAFRDVLCSVSSGAGLTEARNRNSGFEALIAAHEIGHNFGAVHDGEVPTDPSDPDCQTTPSGQFLMSPSVDAAHGAFSQCSLDTVRPRIAAASCITALPPANLSVAADLGTFHHGLSQAFELVIPVTNIGGLTATSPRTEILVPPSLLVDDAHVDGGSCTSLAGVINCGPDQIAGGARVDVHLTLRSNVIGSNSFSIRVTADSDSQSTNNSGDGTIIIDPEVTVSDALVGASQSNVSKHQGGGGAAGAILLIALGLLAASRNRWSRGAGICSACSLLAEESTSAQPPRDVFRSAAELEIRHVRLQCRESDHTAVQLPPMFIN